MRAQRRPGWEGRRTILASAFALAAAAAMPHAAGGGPLDAGPPRQKQHKPAAQARKLNVLFIISDDLRTELGCYGRSLARTPNVDGLAAVGVRFDRAYCQFPLCNPSRASMLTGRQPTSTGVLGNRIDFRAAHPDFVTLPQLFRQNGYAALRAGKIFHGGIDDLASWTEGGDKERILPGASGTAQPRDVSLPPAQSGPPAGPDERSRSAHSDRWIVLEGNGEANGDYNVADQAIQYLRDNKDRPFFLGCGFSKPHSPPAAPQRFYDLYDLALIPLPPDFAPRPTVPEGFPSRAIRPRNADLFIDRDATEQAAKEVIRAYLASVSWMDWNVGRVVTELDRLGLRDKTIIVFWGDNGYQLGERGKWSKAGSLFEQGARIPFIVVAPNANGNGQVCPRVVESVDFYPTLAELCRLPLPRGVEGRSLAKLLDDPLAAWDHPAYTIWSEDGSTIMGVSVRIERWRYAEFDGGAGGAMLFDEQADPNELRNLVADPQCTAVRAELSALARKYAAGWATK
jgi:arylsulfatase A-like enzyme